MDYWASLPDAAVQYTTWCTVQRRGVVRPSNARDASQRGAARGGAEPESEASPITWQQQRENGVILHREKDDEMNVE